MVMMMLFLLYWAYWKCRCINALLTSENYGCKSCKHAPWPLHLLLLHKLPAADKPSSRSGPQGSLLLQYEGSETIKSIRIFSSDASKIEEATFLTLFPISFSFIMSSIMTSLGCSTRATAPRRKGSQTAPLHSCAIDPDFYSCVFWPVFLCWQCLHSQSLSDSWRCCFFYIMHSKGNYSIFSTNYPHSTHIDTHTNLQNSRVESRS